MPNTKKRSNTRIFSILGKISIVLLYIWLSACSILSKDPNNTDLWDAKKFYEEAKEAIRIGDYESAINYLETMEARFPFGVYAQQAQLDIAYSYYKFDEPDSAIAAADRFIKLYPRHDNVDYAFYLKGLASYHKGMNVAQGYVSLDATKRDAQPFIDAFNFLSSLIDKYPDSKYIDDSLQRLVFIRNQLAQHELNIAEYYFGRKAYVASVNRGKYILEHFPRTQAVPKALALMAKAYDALGIEDLADDTRRVLSLNQPTQQP